MATGAGNKPVPFRMECVSADGRCTQPVNPDRSVLPDGRFLRFENEGNSSRKANATSVATIITSSDRCAIS